MADVDAALKDWSSTSNSNKPSGSTSIGTSLDDNLREIQGSVVRGLSHKGADIASAATTDLGAVEGLAHDITGTTTITSFGTVRAGIWKILKFEGALTLTHNATSLILPGAANITTADGDIAIVISEGSGNWRCVHYIKVSGAPLLVASQSDQETSTSVVAAVTPGRQQYHPSAAKGWCEATMGGTAAASYNVTSVTDAAAGVAEIAWATDFSGASYCAIGCGKIDHGGAAASTYISTIRDTNFAAGVTGVQTVRASDWASVDPTHLMVVVFGDQ